MKRSREMEMEMKSEIRSAIEELSLMVKVRAAKVKAKAGDDHDKAAIIHIEQEESKIPTKPFLALCGSVLQILDEIGPTMAVLRQDVDQNIQRLEILYENDPPLYSNLVEILKKEATEGTAKKSTSCSRAILWLTRTLDFSVELLQRIAKDKLQNMEQAVEESYNITLKPWHGWISSAAFKVALKLVPDDQTFISILKGKSQENFESFKEELQNLILLLTPFLDEVHSTLILYDLDRLKAT